MRAYPNRYVQRTHGQIIAIALMYARVLQITHNPPFNVDKVKAEAAKNAARLPFGLPTVNKANEVGNANYLWISYFYAYLNEHGRAGFVMASSATDSQGKDKDIREQLIKTGHVDAMISVGNNFFYTKSLPCSLWFFDKGKPEELQDKVLFIDARNYFTVVDRTLNEWSEWQLKNLNAIDGVPEGWTRCTLEDVIYFNPKVVLNKERIKQCVPMSALSTSSMVLDETEFTLTSSNSGSKFQNGDTLLARITPCLENGKTGFVDSIKSPEGAVGSTEFIVMRSKMLNPYMVYLLSRTEDFRETAIKSMTGTR